MFRAFRTFPTNVSYSSVEDIACHVSYCSNKTLEKPLEPLAKENELNEEEALLTTVEMAIESRSFPSDKLLTHTDLLLRMTTRHVGMHALHFILLQIYRVEPIQLKLLTETTWVDATWVNAPLLFNRMLT